MRECFKHVCKARAFRNACCGLLNDPQPRARDGLVVFLRRPVVQGVLSNRFRNSRSRFGKPMAPQVDKRQPHMLPMPEHFIRQFAPLKRIHKRIVTHRIGLHFIQSHLELQPSSNFHGCTHATPAPFPVAPASCRLFSSEFASENHPIPRRHQINSPVISLSPPPAGY
jgi:hypothetical protein